MNPPRGIAAAALAVCALAPVSAQQAQNDGQTFKFRTGVALMNVTATVTDRNGHFVSGLRKEDFRVYEDDKPQPITHFDRERVPVSLGIVLDTSASMAGEKMAAARAALRRFLFELLDSDDEVFLYRFDSTPELVVGWTTDRRRVGDELARLQPNGGTALYDAVAEAIPLAQAGRHKKKALVIISDGNDTSSHIATGTRVDKHGTVSHFEVLHRGAAYRLYERDVQDVRLHLQEHECEIVGQFYFSRLA